MYMPAQKSALSSTFVSILIFLYMQGHRSHGGSRVPYVLLKETYYHYNLLYLLFNWFYLPNFKI